MTPAAEFDPPRARQLALTWLARREYGARELFQKLVHKGCPEATAERVAAALVAENLLSEERFVESLVRVRRARGFGPARIRRELEQKGVLAETIESRVDIRGDDWIEQIDRVRRKRFGDALPVDATERARQARFLQYRGYTFDQIRQALDRRRREI